VTVLLRLAVLDHLNDQYGDDDEKGVDDDVRDDELYREED